MTTPVLRRLTIDASLTFARQFFGGLCQLGSVLLVGRLLGPEGTGVYSIALLLPMLLTLLLGFGINASNVYLVASRQFTLSHAWNASRNLSFFQIPIGFLIGFAIIIFYGEELFPGVDQKLLFLAMLIFPSGLITAIFLSLVQAAEDFRDYNIIVLVQPVSALLLLVVLWIVSGFTLQSAISVIALSYLIGVVVGYILLRKRIDVEKVGRTSTYLRPAIRYGIKAQLSNIVGFLNYRLDIFIVNLIVGPAATGLYSIAVRLVEQLWLVSSAVSTVLLPRLSSMVGDDKGRGALTAIVSRATLYVTLAASGILAALSTPLIGFLFGPDFSDASIALLVLLPGVVLVSSGRVIANDLAARGRVGVNFTLAIVTLVLNTAGNLVLIPLFGIAGAAIATTIAYFSDFLIRLIIMNRISKIPWWQFIVSYHMDFGHAKMLFRKGKSN